MNKIEQVLTPMTRFAAALGYEPSEAQKAALTAYVQGYQLLLAGKAGTGKTWFFKALKIAKLSCCEIYDITEESKQCVDWILQDLREYYKHREIVIDDIGRESPKIDYGERTEVLDLILNYREKHCPGVRTHLVTNLTLDEILARYGERVLSRMHYCKPISFLDEDKRCAKRFIGVSNFCPYDLAELEPDPEAENNPTDDANKDSNNPPF